MTYAGHMPKQIWESLSPVKPDTKEICRSIKWPLFLLAYVFVLENIFFLRIYYFC
jgi:hypothetical protein